ncbi:MAG TPA: hypothetical protein VME45_03240 [Stellaceae bacterium]|nr:hypothetical protein [Stellaceae bacterium]
MLGSTNDFALRHSGEIREALIMIEGEDGAFELLAHGWLTGEGAGEEPFALVRSLGTDRVHLLVHHPDLHHVYSWHRIGRDALVALQNRVARLRARTDSPEGAEQIRWRVSASEKPRSPMAK